MHAIVTCRGSTYDTADSEEKAKKQVHQLSPQHPVMTDQEAEIPLSPAIAKPVSLRCN